MVKGICTGMGPKASIPSVQQQLTWKTTNFVANKHKNERITREVVEGLYTDW